MNVNSVFYSEDEKLVKVLGQEFFNASMNNDTRKGTLILSDKRVYLIGNGYEKSAAGNLLKVGCNSTVNTSDITGVSTVVTGRIGFAIVSMLLFMLIILLSTTRMLYQLIPFSSILMILFLVLYIMSIRKYLALDYAGGCIAINYKWYGKKKVLEFQKSVFLEKDKLLQK